MLLFRPLASLRLPGVSAFRDSLALAKLILAMLVSVMLLPGLALAQTSISVLVTEPKGFYQDAADSLTRALRQEGWKVTVSTPENYSSNSPSLTVAIGTPALEKALVEASSPILSLLVPRSTYERLASGKSRVSALYLDQPLTRQLQLLKLALPGLKKAGVPLGPVSRESRKSLGSAVRDSGVLVDSPLIDRSSDLYSALTELAVDSQAFILLPDPLVAQRSNLQNFFLHTYRLKKPVLAYSAPLAKTGAVLALFATPTQMGEEAADWIRQSWMDGVFRLGEPRYPERFSIAINRTVARSLDIELPSEQVLSDRLGALQ